MSCQCLVNLLFPCFVCSPKICRTFAIIASLITPLAHIPEVDEDTGEGALWEYYWDATHDTRVTIKGMIFCFSSIPLVRSIGTPTFERNLKKKCKK